MKNQYCTSVWVSWLAIALCWSTVYMYNQSGFVQYQTYGGVRIKQEFVYLEDRSRGTNRCASMCAVNKSCLSASFSNDEGLCWMSAHLIDGSENQHRLEVVESWRSMLKNECMAGWVGLDGTCYYLLEETTNFTDGQTYCDLKGGKMAEPQTEDEFETLRSYLIANNGTKSFWFGLNKPANDTLAKWISNEETPNYYGWMSEPGDKLDELCVAMFKFAQYKWLYTGCHRKYYIVCEI